MPTPNEAVKTVQFSIKHVAPPKALHYLTVVQGVTIERAVPVTSEPLILGRDPSRPFFLPDADVSRSHCQLRVVEDTLLVRDLDSTNGTFVDGVQVTAERELPVSSQLQVGRHALRHELLSAEDVARHEQFARDLERARLYVEALLPPPLEHGPVRSDWCFVPSSVLGGDALGYHDLGDGRLALYVLDVCGHGVSSAMHSASVLNAVRRQTLPSTDFGDPGQVLERLNEVFQMEEHSGIYFSMFYAVLNSATHELRYSSAGHPPALLLGADGEIRFRLVVKNPPIGTQRARAFGQAVVAFEPGERLYLFSDGAFEIQDRDGRECGLDDFERQLVAVAADRSSGQARRLYDASCSAAGTKLLADDFTMLIVEHAPNTPR